MIKNGRDVKLNQNSGTLPNVSQGMKNWFQQITFEVVTKTIVDFKAYEETVFTNFMGVVQPMSPEQLELKSEGQRSWPWWIIHAETSLVLKNDDKINYLGKNFRVMSKSNYESYGYYEYHLVEDYDVD